MNHIQLKNTTHLSHVAIMKKEWGLIPKILSGEKKLESRWYMNKARPWGHVFEGDTIYFKNSGEPVTAKAIVSKVIQIGDLNSNKVRELLSQYLKDLGIDSHEQEIYFERYKDKRYAVLIFLQNPERVESFEINKKGFGAMSAWITADCIDKLKVNKE